MPGEKPLTLVLHITDDIAPGENTLTLNSYERLTAECERTGMSIDEVLDLLIARALPHPDDDESDDG